ncbi:MAG: hypothetical protein JWQ03_2737, partial [Variovorax sp.]|nr:hypothetical protein [Variovorax sp.]
MNAATSMIERASDVGPTTAVPLAADAPHLTAGAMLRQAREANGVRLDVLAAALKVPAQRIEALEHDAFEELPDPVFARALAASVCRALRVDAAPVLAKLPGVTVAAGLADADKTLSSSFSRGRTRGGRGGWRLSRLLLSVVGLLLVGAAALLFLPQSVLDGFSASLGRAAQRDPAASASVEGSTGQAATARAPAGTVVEPVASAPVPAAAATAAMPTPAIAAPLIATAPDAPVAGSDALVFSARAESWITVTDARRTVLLKRKLAPGETIGVSGTPP